METSTLPRFLLHHSNTSSSDVYSTKSLAFTFTYLANNTVGYMLVLVRIDITCLQCHSIKLNILLKSKYICTCVIHFIVYVHATCCA